MHTTTPTLAQLADSLGVALKGRPLTIPEAAQVLRCSPATLSDWRHDGTGPRYFKLGDRFVRYSERDLLDWLAACARRSTSQLVAA